MCVPFNNKEKYLQQRVFHSKEYEREEGKCYKTSNDSKV